MIKSLIQLVFLRHVDYSIQQQNSSQAIYVSFLSANSFYFIEKCFICNRQYMVALKVNMFNILIKIQFVKYFLLELKMFTCNKSLLFDKRWIKSIARLIHPGSHYRIPVGNRRWHVVSERNARWMDQSTSSLVN